MTLASSVLARGPETVKIVVPFAPGGPSDFVAKIAQTIINQNTTVTAYVEYRPGAGGDIGTALVANARASETVLLINSVGVVINLFKNPDAYDYGKLIPVAGLGRMPLVLVASRKFMNRYPGRWQQLDARPINFASAGFGTTSHVTAEFLKTASGKNLVHVPYKGIAQAIPDLISGNVDVAFLQYPIALKYIESGQLVPIAVESPRRLEKLPRVPTLQEQGYANLGYNNWFMLFSNDTNNTELIANIRRAFDLAVRDPAQSRIFADNDITIDPKIMMPDRNFLILEKARYTVLLRNKNIKLEQ